MTIKIKLANKFKYYANIQLTVANDFNLEKFEDQLDDLARNLAEQQDADVEITNFYPKFLFKTLNGGQK